MSATQSTSAGTRLDLVVHTGFAPRLRAEGRLTAASHLVGVPV